MYSLSRDKCYFEKQVSRKIADLRLFSFHAQWCLFWRELSLLLNNSKKMIIVFRYYFKQKFYILLPKNDYINILNTTYFNLSSLLSLFVPAEFFSYTSLLLYIAEFYAPINVNPVGGECGQGEGI